MTQELNQVEAWIHEVLSSASIKVTGPIQEVQWRSWSAIYRVPTAGEEFYCKVCGEAERHEPGLTQALAIWAPHVTLPVIASDLQRGYILMPGGGDTLRQKFESGAGISLWLKILPVYADLQISMVAHRQELLDLGIIDRRLASLPSQFAAVLSDTTALLIGKKDGLTVEEHTRLSSEMPIFEQLCGRLGSLGIPETLEHDDFHDGNIFYNHGMPRFFDWGETCLAHPFFSMVVALNSISYRFGFEPGDAQWVELRDAYLAPWEKLFERGCLLEAFDLSMQVGAVNRALTWYLVLRNLPAKQRNPDADAVPGWLQQYLERRTKYASDDRR